MKKAKLKPAFPKHVDYALAVEWEVKADGRLIVRAPEIPDCRAQGSTPEEALENLRRLIGRTLQDRRQALFAAVEPIAQAPALYALEEFRGHLFAATCRDTVLRSSSGLAGSFQSHPVAKTPSKFFNSFLEQESGKGDYTAQVYCLRAFAPPGKEARLYAGTNVSGTVYVSDDGTVWKEAFVTGEDRVHVLVEFKGRLYAGTSSAGKVFAFDGVQWNTVGALQETAVTALGVFQGKIFAGTYPTGLIFRSENGLAWEETARTQQTFVQSFQVFQNRLYAGTSGPSGIRLFVSENGRDWQVAYQNNREMNLYALAVFDGALYLGTGNNGRILRTFDGRRFETVYAGDVEGIRCFTMFHDRLFAATENPGLVLKSTFDTVRLPKIQNVEAEILSSCEAVVRWETDIPATSEVRYGEVVVAEMEAPFLNAVENRTLSRKHQVRLTGLKAGSTYRFQVASATQSAAKTLSPVSAFRTAEVPKPLLECTTHSENEWTARKEARVFAKAPSRVLGFYYKIDRKEDTVPAAPDALFSPNGEIHLVDLPQGEYWLHVAALDEAGNSGGKAAHLRFRVDTEAKAPGIFRSPTHPHPDRWYAKSAFRVEWDEPEDFSGIAGYWVALRREPVFRPDAKTGQWCEKPFFEGEVEEDGVWYVHVAAKDKAGNVSAEAGRFILRVDRNVSPARILKPSLKECAGWTPKAWWDVEWEEPEDLSGVEGYLWALSREEKADLSGGKAHWTSERTLALELPEDGAWFFHLQVKDRAGNLSLPVTLELKRDTEAPPPKVRSSTHPDPKTWNSKRRVTLEWDEPEDRSGVEGYFYRFDRSKKTLPTPENARWTTDRRVTFEVPEDGEWVFHVLTRDKAGNLSKEATHFPVKIDSTCGTPRISSPTHPNQNVWSARRKAVFHVEPPEGEFSGVQGFHFVLTRSGTEKIDFFREPFSEKKELSLDVPGDGVYFLHVAARDGAGNLSEKPAVYRIQVDTQCAAPVLHSPTHPDGGKWFSSPHVRVEWDAPRDDSGVVGYYTAWRREENWVPDLAQMQWTAAREVQWRAPEDGMWVLYVAARDAAGNLSPCAKWTVKLDFLAQAPVVRSRTHEAGRWSADPAPVLEWEEPKELSGVAGYFVCVDENPTTIPGPQTGRWVVEPRFSCPPLSAGRWWFHVTVQDKAGNLGREAAHYPLWIDSTAPQSRMAALPAFLDRTRIPVEWDAADDLSGVAFFDVEVREGEGPWKPWLLQTTKKSAVFEGKDGERYAFRCRAVDQVGNTEPFPGKEQTACRVDISPPPPVERLRAASRAKGAIALEWDPVSDAVSGTAFYRVYRSSENEPKRCVADRVEKTQWTDEGMNLVDGKIYTYSVHPVDRMGNERHEGNAEAQAISDHGVEAPLVSSPTHPQGEWCAQAEVVFLLKAPNDATGVKGYSYWWKQEENPPQDLRSGTFITSDRVVFSNVEDGRWFFFAVAHDVAGNVSGTPAVYAVCIDREKPEPPRLFSTTHADEGRWYRSRRMDVRFQEKPKRSGLEAFYWVLSRSADPPTSLEGAKRSADSRLEVVLEDTGEWFFHAAVRDRAGNVSDFAVRKVCVAGPEPPPPLVESPTHPSEDEAVPATSAVFQWRENHDGSFSTQEWFWRVSPEIATTLSKTDAKTDAPHVRVDGLSEGVWYFHAAAAYRGEPSPLVARRRFIVKRVGALAGFFYSKDGKNPIAGVRVELRQGEKKRMETTTSAKGAFQFVQVPEGHYDFYLWPPGGPVLLIRDIAVEAGKPVRPVLFTEDCGVYPFPAEPGPVRFYYQLREDCHVTVEIFDQEGKPVDRLEERKEGGVYAVTLWDAAGKPEGEYVAKITAKNLTRGAVSRFTMKKFRIKKAGEEKEHG